MTALRCEKKQEPHEMLHSLLHTPLPTSGLAKSVLHFLMKSKPHKVKVGMVVEGCLGY